VCVCVCVCVNVRVFVCDESACLLGRSFVRSLGRSVETRLIGLEYWNILVLDLYLTQKTLQPQALLLGSLHQQPQSSRVLGM
jgi:hypothetical protein